MLKKLRMKFTMVIMTIVTIMLGIIFGMLYISTSKSMERESIQMMSSMAMNPRLMKLYDNQVPNYEENLVRFPYFTLLVNSEGETIELMGGFYDLSDEELIHSLVQMVFETEEEIGVLKEYDLRFLRFVNPGGEMIVFADMRSERFILRNLVKTLAMVGIIAYVFFLGISLLLARWVVKPVEKAWKQQKQFIADASHELKTPLTVIMTDAELLQESKCSEKDREQLYGSILTMSEQMRGLVESMLELARVDDGMTQKNMEQVAFSELISNVSMIFEPVLFEKDLLFSYEIEPDIMLHGHKEQLGQLVNILLDNAGKYALSGGNVLLSLKSSQYKHCLLTVSNQGEPISEENMEHLFERFYRVDKARSRNQSYGLGLSIAQSIVEKHHGKIWAESKNGYNTFYIEL